jgi:hypothetical protein
LKLLYLLAYFNHRSQHPLYSAPLFVIYKRNALIGLINSDITATNRPKI